MTEEKKPAKSGKKTKTKKKTKPTKINIEKKLPSLEEMLKAGVHFGHRVSKWSPKMEQYIFTARNNIHIIDLEKTREKLEEALKFIQGIKNKKGIILFVGTKVAAKEITRQMAQECQMPYVVDKWIGGTLTNFGVISKRLEHFRDLEKKKESGELKKYTKKEQHEFGLELQKLDKQFGGIKAMIRLPDALLVVDIHKEKLAVKEANMKKIPVIGLCDTNADPEIIDYPIPANDDASSSLKLILGIIVGVLK